jgi:hypothetical protein
MESLTKRDLPRPNPNQCYKLKVHGNLQAQNKGEGREAVVATSTAPEELPQKTEENVLPCLWIDCIWTKRTFLDPNLSTSATNRTKLASTGIYKRLGEAV